MEVWVSVDNPWGEPHGTRPYHQKECSYLEASDLGPGGYWKPMSKAKAESQDRKPCGRCRP